MDKVVRSVNETNGAQIVMDNDTNLKELREILMQKKKKKKKRKHLFWTLCATNCIILMLKDVRKKKNVAYAIIKARSIT